MAINLAEKYSSKVDERFTLNSLTEAAVNQDYEWNGVKSIKVYSIPTVALGDYERTGSNRYGTPAELQDTIATYEITQDKSFTFTVDKGNDMEQLGVKNAGRALSRQTNEVSIPHVDTYRLTKMVAGAGTTKASEVITKDNAYEAFLDANVALNNNKVPATGRIAFVKASVYKFLKLDDSFIKSTDLAQNMLVNGQVGQVDGVAIVLVPDSYFPANINFIVTHKIATVSPKKLDEYKIHIDPPGISGALVEGRMIHDTFVLENKKVAIYVSKAVA